MTKDRENLQHCGARHISRSHQDFIRCLWCMLCALCVAQLVLLGVMTIRHNFIMTSQQQRLVSLRRRAEILLYECSSSKNHVNLAQQRAKRIGVTQITTQLEAILERHCSNGTQFCMPGEKGDSGLLGHTGIPGNVGEVGQPGWKGASGIPGNDGAKGIPGNAGFPGAKGVSGQNGGQGQKGETGTIGPAGDRGMTGTKGGRGGLGEKGQKGDYGQTGPHGDSGPTGMDGPKGQPGPILGTKGQQGPDGPKGPRSPKLPHPCVCSLATSPTQSATTVHGHNTNSHGHTTTTTAPVVRRVISSCDFERDTCGWTNLNNVYGWLRGTQHMSDYTQPSTDHTTHSRNGHYMYTNTFFGLSEMTTNLLSQTVPSGDYCIEFYYFLHGQRAGSIALRTQTGSHVSQQLWTVSGDQGNAWHKAQVTVTSSTNFRFDIEARFGGQMTADAFVDDVTISTGPCP